MSHPLIESSPNSNNVHVLHMDAGSFFTPHKDEGEIALLDDFTREHAGKDAILIIDLSSANALYYRNGGDGSDGGEPGFASGNLLPYISTGLEKHGIGVIFSGLNPALKEHLKTTKIAQNLTFAATMDDAKEIANILQENPTAKADWMASEAPITIISKLRLQEEVPTAEQVGKNTYVMTMPWKVIHPENISAFFAMADEFIKVPKRVGERRTIILDLSAAKRISGLLMPALAEFRDKLDKKGDRLRIVSPDEIIESQIDEHEKTRNIPIFPSVNQAKQPQTARGA